MDYLLQLDTGLHNLISVQQNHDYNEEPEIDIK